MRHPNSYGFREIVERKLYGENPPPRRRAEGYQEIYHYVNQGGRNRDPILGTMLLHEYHDEKDRLREAWLTVNGKLLTLDEVKSLWRVLPPYGKS